MRHAYLIIAHSNWKQLNHLIHTLDSPNNDIYIHIDKKAKNVPLKEFYLSVKKSSLNIYQVYEVYWGSYELVQTELFLFGEAHKKHYDYYHLLSGADFPIKSQQYIYDFFEKYNGYEFVHYDTDQRLLNDKEIIRRTKLYHLLQNHRRKYRQIWLNSFFTFFERMILAIQLLLRVDRMKKHPHFNIKYGSQWVSITDDLVSYILSQQTLVNNIFKYTNCADELFIQSLVFNSDYKSRLYDQNYDDNMCGNMRLLDIKKRGRNGNPYVWRINDWEEIVNSQCLFARKFDMNVDADIVRKVCTFIKK